MQVDTVRFPTMILTGTELDIKQIKKLVLTVQALIGEAPGVYIRGNVLESRGKWKGHAVNFSGAWYRIDRYGKNDVEVVEQDCKTWVEAGANEIRVVVGNPGNLL